MIPRLNIDRAGINKMIFVLMVVTAVIGMIFYFAKRERMGRDFPASIFVGSPILLNEEIFVSRDLVTEIIDASFELDSAQIEKLEGYSLLATAFN